MEDKTIDELFSDEINHYKKVRNLSIAYSTFSTALTGVFVYNFVLDTQNPINVVIAAAIGATACVSALEAKINQDKIKEINNEIELIKDEVNPKRKFKVIK